MRKKQRVINMDKIGYDIDLISQVSELSINDIKTILNQNVG